MKKNLYRNLFGVMGVLLAASVLGYACTDDEWDFSKRTEPVTPITAVYVEVNDVNPLNALCYTMNGKPFFNYVILFAANINGTEDGRVELACRNGNMGRALALVPQLHDGGVKVLMSVLGNHTGLGVANLTDEQVEDFATQIAETVEEFGLDGVDFDDEYAEYGTNGFAPANATSYAKLIRAVRDKLPAGKLITVFDVDTGNSKTLTTVKDCVDYAWSEQYGQFKGRCRFGLGNKQFCGYSQKLDIPFVATETYTVKSNIKLCMQSSMGALIFYDLRKTPEVREDPTKYDWDPSKYYTLTTEDVRQILNRTAERAFNATVEVTDETSFYEW